MLPEDVKKRNEWRNAAAVFRQYKQLADRLKEESPDSVEAANILRLHGEAVKKADSRALTTTAIHLLAEATVAAKEAQKTIDRTKEKIAQETAGRRKTKEDVRPLRQG